MHTPYQRPLFTVRGNAANPEQMKRDLRVAVLEQLGDTFGILPIEEDERCPECEGALQMVMHPHAPTVFCACGWVLAVRAEDLEL